MFLKDADFSKKNSVLLEEFIASNKDIKIKSESGGGMTSTIEKNIGYLRMIVDKYKNSKNFESEIKMAIIPLSVYAGSGWTRNKIIFEGRKDIVDDVRIKIKSHLDFVQGYVKKNENLMIVDAKKDFEDVLKNINSNSKSYFSTDQKGGKVIDLGLQKTLQIQNGIKQSLYGAFEQVATLTTPILKGRPHGVMSMRTRLDSLSIPKGYKGLEIGMNTQTIQTLPFKENPRLLELIRNVCLAKDGDDNFASQEIICDPDSFKENLEGEKSERADYHYLKNSYILPSILKIKKYIGDEKDKNVIEEMLYEFINVTDAKINDLISVNLMDGGVGDDDFKKVIEDFYALRDISDNDKKLDAFNKRSLYYQLLVDKQTCGFVINHPEILNGGVIRNNDNKINEFYLRPPEDIIKALDTPIEELDKNYSFATRESINILNKMLDFLKN